MRIDEIRNNWTGRFFENSFYTAYDMLDDVENAISKFVDRKVDIFQFIKEISEFDEYAYRLYWGASQKSNWLNTGQNKAYPIIKETIWSAVFEVIRQELVERTGIPFVLIQGERQKVAVAVFENGNVKYKDVDAGIGLVHDEGFTIPVIAVECKGGHACSTCHDGIWGQGMRMKAQFPNSLQAFVTDNNITVAKKTDISTYSTGIDLEWAERGVNNSEKFAKSKGYNALNAQTFSDAIKQCVNIVSSFNKDHWLVINDRYKNTGEKWRDSLDSNGSYVNPKYRHLV